MYIKLGGRQLIKNMSLCMIIICLVDLETVDHPVRQLPTKNYYAYYYCFLKFPLCSQKR